MQLHLSIHDPQHHRFQIQRAPHPSIDLRLDTRSFLLHDLAHFAYEAQHGITHGFYGLLADGISLNQLRESTIPNPVMWQRLMEVEGPVARLQTAFRRQEAIDDPSYPRLRQLHGAWRKVRMGEALALTWPNGSPEVVTVSG